MRVLPWKAGLKIFTAHLIFAKKEDIRDRLATSAVDSWKITGLELLEEKRIDLSSKRDAGVDTFIGAGCHSCPLAPKPRTAIFLFSAFHL